MTFSSKIFFSAKDGAEHGKEVELACVRTANPLSSAAFRTVFKLFLTY